MSPIEPHDPGEGDFLKMLVHSPGGHGKTRLLGTAQEDERTYPMALLNFDAGVRTLAGLKVDVYDVRDMQDYNEAYAQISEPSTKYRSVGLDSVSETQVGGMLAILDKPNAHRDGPDSPERGDWGTILIQMRRLIRHFKFLDMHVFMTALSKSDALPRIGSVQRPSLQGQFADDILGIPDVVAYLALEDDDDGEEPRRVLLLHSNPKFMVKCRTPWGAEVPSEIVDPTVTKVLDALGFEGAVRPAPKRRAARRRG